MFDACRDGVEAFTLMECVGVGGGGAGSPNIKGEE
jgi:hypothetical protein